MKSANNQTRQTRKYSFFKILSQSALVLAVTMLLGVVIFILIRGLPYIDYQLLFGEYGRYPSIKPALVGTLYLIVIAIITAAPIGIATAVYLVEYTGSKSRMVKYIRIATETLAGIPSIVYGLFGYLVFVVALKLGYSLIGGGLTLGIMILPVIVRSTEESLLSVPQGLREGSYALGTSKVRTIFSVVIPSASGGIVTAIILAIGRVISESAVLILTIGMVVNRMPDGITSAGTSLALDVYYFGSQGYPEQAAATAVVLLLLIIAINLTATGLGKLLNKGNRSRK